MASDSGIKELKKAEAEAQELTRKARENRSSIIKTARIKAESEIQEIKEKINVKLAEMEIQIKADAEAQIAQSAIKINEDMEKINNLTEKNKKEAIQLLLDTVSKVVISRRNDPSEESIKLKKLNLNLS